MEHIELAQASEILLRDLVGTQKGEIVIITADRAADAAVAEQLFAAATQAGAKPLLVWMNTPAGVSEAADPDLPAAALTALLEQADIWLELNKQWLLYSGIFYVVKKTNPRLRHICLTGVDAGSMIGCVGSVDYEAMREFTLLLQEMIASSREMRMTSALGEDIRFTNSPDHPISYKLGRMDTPGTHLFVGQIGWTPVLESIEGTIVFDASIAPEIGVLREPITMTVQAGQVCELCGGAQAAQYAAWLRGFNHPQMLRVAHTGIGFNPGAAVVGSIIQDQRVLGSTTWGFGSIGAGLLPPDGIKAPSHSDAVCLKTTLEADGVLWMQDGEFVKPRLAALAARLKR